MWRCTMHFYFRNVYFNLEIKIHKKTSAQKTLLKYALLIIPYI